MGEITTRESRRKVLVHKMGGCGDPEVGPKRLLRSLAGILLAVAAVTILPAMVLAQGRAAHSTIFVLLDETGSMRQSDAFCVRGEAVELLLSVLPDGDMIWLASFADDVVPVTPKPVQLTPGTRLELATAASRCQAGGAHTNIARALDTAASLVATMSQESKESYVPRILLLSDGAHEGRESLPESFRRLEASGAEIRVLALGAGAQASLAAATRGLAHTVVIPAQSPRDLLAEFLASARMASGRWLISDRHEQPGQVSIAVPAWASDWRIVFVPDVPLSGRPSVGTGVQGSSMHGKSYDSLQGSPPPDRRLTVTLPAAGRLIADGAGEILLQSRLPAVVPSAVPFLCRARIVHKAGEDLAGAAFVSGAAIAVRWSEKDRPASAALLYDDGLHFDGKANDGEFGGTCSVEGGGQTPWSLTFSGASAAVLKGSGTATVLARPVDVSWPNAASRSLSALRGVPAALRLQNLTDVDMKITLRTGQVSDQRLLAARSETEFPVPGQPTTAFASSVPITVLAEGAPAALWEGVVPIGGRMAIPAVVLCVAVLLGAAMVLPRRTVAGSTVQVRARETDAEEGFAATGIVGEDGRVAFKGIPPEPFGDLGRFTAQSGLFRSGIVYEAASWMTPAFDATTALSGKGYVLLGSMSTWSVTYKGRKVSYTFSRQ